MEHFVVLPMPRMLGSPVVCFQTILVHMVSQYSWLAVRDTQVYIVIQPINDHPNLPSGTLLKLQGQRVSSCSCVCVCVAGWTLGFWIGIAQVGCTSVRSLCIAKCISLPYSCFQTNPVVQAQIEDVDLSQANSIC